MKFVFSKEISIKEEKKEKESNMLQTYNSLLVFLLFLCGYVVFEVFFLLPFGN